MMFLILLFMFTSLTAAYEFCEETTPEDELEIIEIIEAIDIVLHLVIKLIQRGRRSLRSYFFSPSSCRIRFSRE